MNGNVRPIAVISASIVTIPICYVTYHALTINPVLWHQLWTTRIPELVLNTFSLSIGVSALALIFGLSAAWLTARYSFPGRTLWEALLVLPLAFPAYVLAYIYSVITSNHPLLNKFLYSFWGVSTVIALATFPYIFLLTKVALANLNLSYEEAARSLGANRLERFLRVSIPVLRPSIVAGISIVVLYVLADFGTVSMLRYQTFTLSIYSQMIGRQNHKAAAALSIVLVLISIGFVFLERYFRGASKFYQTQGRFRRRPPIPISPIAAAGVHIFLGLLTFASFIGPALLLIQWSIPAILSGALKIRLFGFALNTFASSAVAAILAICVAFPIAHAAVRHPIKIHLAFLHASYAASSLPGPVTALALLLTALAFIPSIYGSVILLITAYVIRFLPISLQAEEASLHQITPSLENAARSLGAGPIKTQIKVTIPLIRGGLLAAATMVFLNAIKELPATLLLRPIGFDTLAIRVWMETSENMYELAAPAALLMMLVALPALWLLRQSWGYTSSKKGSL